MKTILKAMDIFSFQIDFNYKNDTFFHSTFGFILSFLMYLVMIFFFYFFSRDFIDKTNPIVIFKETEFKRVMDFSIEDFFKGFLYEFSFNDTIKIFGDFDKNQFETFLYSNPMTYLQLNINTDSSYESFIFNDTLEITKRNDGKYRCFSRININKNSDILFYRANNTSILDPTKFNRTDYKYLNLKDFKSKINQYSGIELVLYFDLSFIEKFKNQDFDVTNFLFVYSISDNIMNVDNSEFFNSFNFSRVFQADLINNQEDNKKFYKDQYIFQAIELLDDKGFILNEEINELKLKKIAETKSTPYSFLNNIQLIEIKFEAVMKTYERRYKKLQNVLADLGGLINSFILIGRILIYAINENKFYYGMINHIFDTESPVHPNESKNINFYDKIQKIGYYNNINKNKYIISMNNSSSRSIIPLDHSKIIFKSEGNSRINPERIPKHYDFISYNMSRKKNEKILEFSKIFKKNKKISKEDIKLNIEIPSYHHKKLNKLEKNKFELGDKDSILKNKINQFIKVKNNKTRVIKFERIEFLKMILCFKNFKDEEFLKKEKLFENLTNKIKDYLNIINYCFLFENFEKLKMILLNPIQNFSFNFLNTGNNMSSKNNFEIEMQNAYKYFNSNRDNLNQIDNRLINNMSSNFVNFLD